MANWKSGANAPLGYPTPGNIDTTAKVPVGTIARFVDEDGAQGEGEFIYLAGVASTVLGDAVSYDLLVGATTRLTNAVATNKGWPLAFATAATVADTYGWYQISGLALANVAAGFAAANAVFATATAGVVDDGADAGDQILGARASSAIGTPLANRAYLTINRPHSQGAIT